MAEKAIEVVRIPVLSLEKQLEIMTQDRNMKERELANEKARTLLLRTALLRIESIEASPDGRNGKAFALATLALMQETRIYGRP